ncbi:unnamed protein product, partial [marine sediment metagenome]
VSPMLIGAEYEIVWWSKNCPLVKRLGLLEYLKWGVV